MNDQIKLKEYGLDTSLTEALGRGSDARPLISATKSAENFPTSIIFNQGNWTSTKEVGRLTVTQDTVVFEGNADEAARLFFDNLKLEYEHRFKWAYDRGANDQKAQLESMVALKDRALMDVWQVLATRGYGPDGRTSPADALRNLLASINTVNNESGD